MSTLDPAVYRKAADVIRTGGLRKEGYGPEDDERSPHCTVGALRLVAGHDGRLLAPLADLIGNWPCTCGIASCEDRAFDVVTHWNDRPETTAADVIAVLTEAAEKLEAEQGVTI